ncbi:MAG: multicopper oxidase family protein [Polyangiaceae bacterium]|nr:multicopper oxidase family protein [Polyangiaceae bacterium]
MQERALALPALCLAAACASPEALAPVSGERPADSIPAVDQNPHPDIVEVSLIAEAATVEYLPGRPASVWAYRDGAAPGAAARVPGPLIEAKQGDLVIVHFRNELVDDGTTVHFHGVRLPAEMDGAHHALLPGEEFDHVFVAKDAGTFWYHPHVRADEQIERGLYGALHVRDREAQRSPAERVLVLDDVKLAEDGDLAGAWTDLDIAFGRQGNTLLVNGVPVPTLRTGAGSRERWHLVNSSNGRFFELELAGRTFEVIGWDGGRINEPYIVETLPIAPGERYDVLVDVGGAPGDRIELRTLPSVHNHAAPGSVPEVLLKVEIDEGGPRDAAPGQASPILPLPIDDATPTRAFALTEDIEGKYGPQFFINGEFWPFNVPIQATLGDVEIWEIRNESDGAHPFHLHGMFFQVLSRDGEPENRLGWKDTVVVPGWGTLRFAVQYDEPGRWMYHCQIPEHAERGMMGEVLVTAP